MSPKIVYFALILMLMPSLAMAQKYRDDENTDPKAKPQKVGVRSGLAMGWLQATENLSNPTLQVGLQGSIYYRINLAGSFHLHTELGAAYRGARFKNGETGYNRIGLFYADLPIYAMFSLDKKQDHNIMVGPVISHLIRSSLFLGNEYYPSFTGLPIKSFDYSVGISYLFSTEIVGLSISYKHGLTNIIKSPFETWPNRADGQTGTGAEYLRDVTPSINNITSIMIRSIELSILF